MRGASCVVRGASDSLCLRYGNGLPISQSFLSYENYRLVRVEATDDFKIDAVIEANLNLGAFCLVVCHREHVGPSLLSYQGLDRRKQSIFFPLNANPHERIH